MGWVPRTASAGVGGGCSVWLALVRLCARAKTVVLIMVFFSYMKGMSVWEKPAMGGCNDVFFCIYLMRYIIVMLRFFSIILSYLGKGNVARRKLMPYLKVSCQVECNAMRRSVIYDIWDLCDVDKECAVE